MKVPPPSPTAIPPSPDVAQLRAGSGCRAGGVRFWLKCSNPQGLAKRANLSAEGAGEDQFSSFLVQQQARQMAQSGGVGLSEILFKSMMEKTDDG